MVYLIQIGNRSRRGTFNKLHEKAVLVDDETTYNDVAEHFKGKYEGFSIILHRLETEPVKVLPPCPQSSIGDFVIRYTEKEKELHEKYMEAEKEARCSLADLHESITSRYAKLFYSDIGNFDRRMAYMELETDDEETVCRRFPVKAELFAEAAKECDGAIPAETEPPAREDCVTG